MCLKMQTISFEFEWQTKPHITTHICTVSMLMYNSRRVEGDVAALREELSKFLFEKYEQEFISQANELMQKVVFRGNFDADFKEFLKMKGF